MAVLVLVGLIVLVVCLVACVGGLGVQRNEEHCHPSTATLTFKTCFLQRVEDSKMRRKKFNYRDFVF